MKKLILLLVLFLSFSISCSAPKKADLIITNASIMDVLNNEVTPNQLILINEDRITSIDKASNLRKYQSEQIIDIQGKYVMPGLWDNHIHFRGGNELIEANKNLLPLLLAFGVTSIREAGGDITPSVQEWKSLIKKDELAGPTIFTSGPKLDGSNPAWDGSISVTNTEEISIALDSLESINVDYVKMYDGNLTKEAYYGIIEEAEKRGLKTTGHMPLSANLMKAIELGLDGIEHLYYPLKEASPLSDSLTDANAGYGMITPLMETFAPELAFQSFRKIAASEFYVTPTLYVGKTLAELLITDHSNDTMLNYISHDIVDTYQRRVRSAQRGGETYTKNRAFWVESFSNMIKPLYDSGINLLAGSDSGPFNSYTYPGISIHKELELLVNAGLTPAEALRTSVINGPKFFGLQNVYGSIEKGKVADLLILDKNPLDDITNTTSIYAVIGRGSWFSKTELDSLMNSIKN